MDNQNPDELEILIEFLRSPTLRTRVGIWFMPKVRIGREQDSAIRLGIDAVDLSEEMLNSLPAATNFLRLEPAKLTSLLGTIAERPGNDCVLVYNVDLLLAALPEHVSREWWNSLLTALPNRRRALVLAMPEMAGHLMPLASEMTKWRTQGRVAGLLPIL